MKSAITKDDFAGLDRQACLADKLNDLIEFAYGARKHIVDTICQQLAIDDWDHDKRRVVAAFVGDAKPSSIDSLLAHLDIAVDDFPNH